MSDEAAAIAEGARKRAAWAELQPIFTDLRQAMSDKLFGSGVEQADLREKLFLGVQTLDTVERAILKLIEAGEGAAMIRDAFNGRYAAEQALATEGLTRP